MPVSPIVRMRRARADLATVNRVCCRSRTTKTLLTSRHDRVELESIRLTHPITAGGPTSESGMHITTIRSPARAAAAAMNSSTVKAEVRAAGPTMGSTRGAVAAESMKLEGAGVAMTSTTAPGPEAAVTSGIATTTDASSPEKAVITNVMKATKIVAALKATVTRESPPSTRPTATTGLPV